MNKSIKWIIGCVAAVALFIGIYFLYTMLSDKYAKDYFKENLVEVTAVNSQTDLPDESTSLNENENTAEITPNLPNFSVTDMNGNTANLYDYLDKPVVLNFWASWCYPCQSEMPHFEEAYKKHPEVNFLMVNVTVSQGETMNAAKGFIEKNGYSFPVFFDTTGIASSTYNIYSFPTTFFIYKGGERALYATGALSMDVLEEAISMILE